ncbi:MAG: AAA family ATPase [Candidatus Hodarchaeales archaeon]|jgi:adenylate kinase family enzyme
MKVIVLVGLPASGKTSISANTAQKYNIPTLETGTFVYKEVENRGLPITPANIKNTTIDCKKQSDAYFTERLVEFAEIEYANRPVIFISGCRAISEIEFLRKRYGKDSVAIIGFHASSDTRFKRFFNPDRAGAEDDSGAKAVEDKALQNYDNFIARDKKELNFGVGSIFALTDYIMLNDDKKYPFYSMAHNSFIFESIIKSIIDEKHDLNNML